MTHEIGVIYKSLQAEVAKMRTSIREKEELMRLLQNQCEHVWVFDYTCGHKGEDYYICKYCGKLN